MSSATPSTASVESIELHDAVGHARISDSPSPTPHNSGFHRPTTATTEKATSAMDLEQRVKSTLRSLLLHSQVL